MREIGFLCAGFAAGFGYHAALDRQWGMVVIMGCAFVLNLVLAFTEG